MGLIKNVAAVIGIWVILLAILGFVVIPGGYIPPAYGPEAAIGALVLAAVIGGNL